MYQILKNVPDAVDDGEYRCLLGHTRDRMGDMGFDLLDLLALVLDSMTPR